MTTAQTINHLSRQLEDVLDHEEVSGRYKTLGAQLLSQLRKPIQISFVGFPGSGKTALINMMLNGVTVPSFDGPEVVELVYGPEIATCFVQGEDTVRREAGIVETPSDIDGPYRVRLELPEEGLLVQSFAEIRLPRDAARQQALLEYATRSSTILIWCSELFEDNEQDIWSDLPEHVKDHGFLALTMADRQMMKGRLTDRIADLEEYVSEEFFGLYPVATLQAISARNEVDAQKSDMWKLSGGEALYDAITRQVSLGRGEDVDRVKVLLEQLDIEPEQSAVPLPGGAVSAVSPTPVDIVPDTALTRRDALQKSLIRLTKGAEDMLQDVTRLEGEDCADVLECCLETVRDMSDMLSEAAGNDPALTELLEEAQEGENMLLLFQLEKSEDAAADAVTLMLQLKKEITAHAQA